MSHRGKENFAARGKRGRSESGQDQTRAQAPESRSESRGAVSRGSAERQGWPAMAAALALALANGSSLAADEAVQRDTRSVSFEVGTGVQYDSNVAVLDLDTSANAGDVAALLELGASYRTRQPGPVGLQVGYNYSQTMHEDFGAFDVGIHRASANLSLDLDKLDAGAMVQYAHALLDGDEFLVLTQYSPYVSKLIGSRLFLRFAYAYSDKDFATNPGRDARADSVSADSFVFLNGLDTYLVFGLRHDVEDALDAQFDYTGHRLRAQLVKRVPAGQRKLTLKAQLRYELRDYDNPTLSIGERRNDRRYQLEVTGDLPIGDRVIASMGYKRADNRSNLPAVDFDEDVLSVNFRAAF